MAERTPFSLKLISPEGVQYDDEAQIVIVTGSGGDLGVLANHAPLVADLKIGTCKVQTPAGEWHTWATAEGFATTTDLKTTVLVEEAVLVEQISIESADELIAEHRNRIDNINQSGDHEVYSSELNAAQKSIAWGEHLKQLAGAASSEH